MNLNEFLSAIESKTGYRPRNSGNGYSCRCPCLAHNDRRPSLSVCESNGKVLLYCHAGCSFDLICQELGVIPSHLFSNNPDVSQGVYYYYHDKEGNFLYRKLKTPSKNFHFERFESGRWINGLENVQRVLYNLPEVVDAIQEGRTVAIAEGEKDVERLRQYGLVATTNDTGAGKGKWKKNHSEALNGAHILLFFDYDTAGIDHRDNIIQHLKDCVASLKVVNIPKYEVAAKNGKDISDWLKEGHTTSDLKKIIENSTVVISQANDSTNIINNNSIRSISIEELLKMTIDPPEVFLDPFITKSSLGMIYAPRGLGKTFFALGIAMAIASGTSFLKFNSPKPRKVLYLDGEMSIYTMKERVEKIYCSQDVKPPENYFQLVNPFLQEKSLPDLCSNEGQQLLEPLMKDSEVIIVDNLSCWMKSGVENEGESWMPIQTWALRLRREGKAVIFIHHANKNNGQRGTSRREDILDYVIKLDKLKNHDPKNGAHFLMSFEKHRSWFGSDVESLQVKLVDHPDGSRTWIWSIPEGQMNEEAIIEEMRRLQSQGKSYQEIAVELNTSKATVSRKLKK